MFVRPVNENDIPAVLDLSAQADFGLTTLPCDLDYLTRRIKSAHRSFSDIPDEPRGENYLFVLEDPDSGAIVGTSGIVSRVGGFEPFYAYERRTAVRESEKLGVRREISVLHLSAQHDGPCEIGTLFLAPDHRRGGLGALLSRTRFLFMAEYPDAFADTVIAELRGVSDATGVSPFWEGVGRHFFEIDFPKADWLSILDKSFIAELMPTDPIYVPLLPRDVQEVIGKVHPNTEAALRILEGEGFSRTNYVDIFDAGPVVSCARSEIATIRNSVVRRVRNLFDRPETGTPAIVCTRSRDAFRSALGTVVSTGDSETVDLSTAAAKAIGVGPGDEIRFLERSSG